MKKMRTVLGILIFYILMFVSCSSVNMVQTAKTPVDRKLSNTGAYCLNEGLKNKFANKKSEALDLTLFCLEIDSTNTSAYNDMYYYYTLLQDKDAAFKSIKKAVDLSPENIWYQYRLADYYYKNDSLELVSDVYERILSQDSKNVNLYYKAYMFYLMQGKTEEALVKLDKIIELEGITFELLSERNKVLEVLGRDDEILSGLENWILTHPADEGAKLELAQAYARLGHQDKSEQMFLSLLEKDPYNEQINATLLAIYNDTNFDQFKKKIEDIVYNEKYSVSLKQYALASVLDCDSLKSDSVYVEKLLSDAVKFAPKDDTLILLVYAQYLANRGQNDSFISVLQEVYRRDPSVEIANYNLMTYYVDKEDTEKIKEHCVQGIKNSPQELIYYYFLSICYFQESKVRDAIDVLESSLKYISKDSSTELVAYLYSFLGSGYHEVGEVEKSFAAYDKALLYKPDNASVLNDYAYFLALAGTNLEKADKMIRRAYELEPKDLNIIDTFAWVQFVMHNYGTALEYIEMALKIGTDLSDTVYEHAGDIYIMVGNEEKAVEMWNKALEAGSKSKTINQKIKQKKYIKGE